MGARLADDLRDAIHTRLARPVEPKPQPRCVSRIGLRVMRHFQPVDAAQIFAPAEDLPDEAFDRVERRCAGAKGPLRRDADLLRQRRRMLRHGESVACERKGAPVFIVS